MDSRYIVFQINIFPPIFRAISGLENEKKQPFLKLYVGNSYLDQAEMAKK